MRSPRESLEWASKQADYVDVSNFPLTRVDIRYGSKNNILNEDVYGGFQKALLHRIAADKFQVATELLKIENPRMRFFIFDALRPRSAQLRFWALVKDTPEQIYFADPAKGSVHNYGFALDLSLLDENSKELDMGTPYDDLRDLAQPQKEEEFLKSGALSATQLANRKILRSLMVRAGFIPLAHEWWHFDAIPGVDVRSKYTALE